jgi:hypothetical protein
VHKGQNTNLSAGMSYADFAARVAFRSKLACEELAQLSTEDTVSDKLGNKIARVPEIIGQLLVEFGTFARTLAHFSLLA